MKEDLSARNVLRAVVECIVVQDALQPFVSLAHIVFDFVLLDCKDARLEIQLIVSSLIRGLRLFPICLVRRG